MNHCLFCQQKNTVYKKKVFARPTLISGNKFELKYYNVKEKSQTYVKVIIMFNLLI